MDVASMTRKERQAHYAEQRKRLEERKAAQARFKPSAIPQEVKDRAAERDAYVAERHSQNGTTPLGAPKRLGPISGLANLILEGADQANAGDVFGHNERERAELPASNLRPQTPGRPQEKQVADLKQVTKGIRRKPRKKGEPKIRKVHGSHFVAEVPERLKKYMSV
ncbi:hypothetical protein ACFWOT_09020 [Streptomyces sp. NPDC058440]|uniref:hypothetical protein n=1 Tax=Streptomyces sp. NPDC058440 TaxID=3346501 RepID=UPI00366317DB